MKAYNTTVTDGGITMGDHVAIAHNCSILSSDHAIDHLEGPTKDAPSVFAPVVIEDDIWLGAGVRVLKGVTIARGAVVAAGAVVTKDVASYAVVGGVPARELRRREGIEQMSDSSCVS